MLKLLTAYGSTVVVFLALDFLWISLVALPMFRRDVGHLLLAQPNLAVAGLFYLAFAAGIVYFAVNPALVSGNWSQAAIAGAILGFVAYGTYDFTNLSTLKDWTVSLALSDLVWGTVLTAVSATAGFFITRLLPV
ncbi:MAG: DUF2177 family protein [Devosia sp.]